MSERRGLLAVLVALLVLFGVLSDHFLTRVTLVTLANQIPALVVIATGMTFVLVVGGIDLSVGSVLALSSALLGSALTSWGWPLIAAVPVALGAGLVAGAANGIVTVKWGIPSFIVTLGMLEVARGAAYLVTGSQTKYIGGAIERLTTPIVGGLGAPFFLAVVVVAAAQFVLIRTVYGRHLIAVGANETAAWLSGVPPGPVRVMAFTASGLLSAVAAVSQCARLAAADPNAGIGLELQAIAAVVIGGTSLMGGRGSVVTTMLGVLIIAVLAAGLAQLGVQEPTRRLVTGSVIVAAAIVDYYRTRVTRV